MLQTSQRPASFVPMYSASAACDCSPIRACDTASLSAPFPAPTHSPRSPPVWPGCWGGTDKYRCHAKPAEAGFGLIGEPMARAAGVWRRHTPGVPCLVRQPPITHARAWLVRFLITTSVNTTDRGSVAPLARPSGSPWRCLAVLVVVSLDHGDGHTLGGVAASADRSILGFRRPLGVWESPLRRNLVVLTSVSL